MQHSEQIEEATRDTHEKFCRVISNELARHRTNDALANYLSLNQGDVRVNLDDIESLALTLSLEVARQWEEQVAVWRESVQ